MQGAVQNVALAEVALGLCAFDDFGLLRDFKFDLASDVLHTKSGPYSSAVKQRCLADLVSDMTF